MHWVFDIELLHNFFSVVFIDVATDKQLISDYINADIDEDKEAKAKALEKMNHKLFIVYDERNDIRALKRFMSESKESMFIGYNSIGYDNIILDYIYTTDLSNQPISVISKSLKTLNDNIIGYEYYNFRSEYKIKYSNTYIVVDLYTLLYLDKLRVSLKQVEIALKWYKVQEYAMPEPQFWEIQTYYDGNSIKARSLSAFDRYVLDEFVDDLIDYNINDVLATLMLYDYAKPELRQRLEAIKQYKTGTLSDSRSKLADRLMSRAYILRTGLSWFSFNKRRTYHNSIAFGHIISPLVVFRSDNFKTLLNDLKGTVIDLTDEDRPSFKRKIRLNDTTYLMALGGLHSIDTPQLFEKTDDYLLVDADVASYYPRGILNMKVVPEHISPSMLDILEEFTDTRLKAKRSGDKNTADILKIVINALYGKMGSEQSWLYDAKMMYKVTINLQLFLLMLIEDLELNNYRVISANTDGIVTRVPIKRYGEYVGICQTWSDALRFELEYTFYDKYVRTTVNDYLCIVSDTNKIKLKGDFLTEVNVTKGYFAPVIAKAIQAYYVDGKSVSDFIYEHRDIYDFCISMKVGRQFKTMLTGIEDGVQVDTVLQRNNRYYVSTKNTIIRKKHVETGKYTSILKGLAVAIFNDYFRVEEFVDYDINYKWYISKAMNTINKVNREVHTTRKSKNTGRMFDNL